MVRLTPTIAIFLRYWVERLLLKRILSYEDPPFPRHFLLNLTLHYQQEQNAGDQQDAGEKIDAGLFAPGSMIGFGQ